MGEIVTVAVSGPVGSGKSAIAGEIEIALRAIGVPVRWNDEGEKNMTHADWQTALELYNPSVVILEENPTMELDRIFRAAEKANESFGQWMPQAWISAFVRAFQEPRPTPPATGETP
jgi:ABC-type transport system involved in cytochrome bd biosynthesis fused ATPase/permease subunit